MSSSVFKALLGRPLAALSASDFQMEADRYPHLHGAAFGVRTLRPVLRWGAKRGYVREEIARLHSPAPTTRRKRVLAREELAYLLPALGGFSPSLRGLHATFAAHPGRAARKLPRRNGGTSTSRPQLGRSGKPKTGRRTWCPFPGRRWLCCRIRCRETMRARPSHRPRLRGYFPPTPAARAAQLGS